jgi:hypothetical protein
MADKTQALEQRVAGSAALGVGVMATVAHAWNMRGFADLTVIACVSLLCGAITAIAVGNIVIGAIRVARGRGGLKYLVGGLLVAVLSGAAPLYPVLPDRTLVRLPFGTNILADRQERLEQATIDGDVGLTRRLAQAGVGTREPRDVFGNPLLATTRNTQILRAMLESGLDPDARDAKGSTRLMSPWSREIAQVLLEYGASPDARGPGGRTALMFAVTSDTAWAPMLIEASTDLRAVDDTGRGAIDYAVPGGELEQLLQAKAGAPPLRRLADGPAAIDYGRTDWLLAAAAVPADATESPSAPFAGSRLTMESPQLLRGDLIDLRVHLQNPTTQPLGLEVEGRISPAAYFVGGSHDVRISNPYRPQLTQEVRWPRLSLPPGAAGELRLRLLTRAEPSGPLDVTIQAVDPIRDLRTNLSLIRQPDGDHPAVTGSELGHGSWAFLGLVAALALVLAVVVWHYGGPKRRPFLLALVGLFAVSGLLSLFSFKLLLSDARALTAYEETTCTVLDRRIFPETVTVADPGATRSRTTTSYEPRLALRYVASGAERISEGFAVGLMSTGDLHKFALGRQYPCWYDPTDQRQVVVIRHLSPLWVGLLLLPMVLAVGAVVAISWELHDPRSTSVGQ